ncbi:MAG TPA: zf-HC2 domain-containing protein, partial [Gammaproteobacteria bacterium]|nr:zf-HC2 domain-containing protein [Gammaproteobacteria bacterium]
MNCPSELTHSMYADGELSAREAMRLERHAMTCTACRTRIDTLRDENEVLRTALKHADDFAAIPRFAPPPRARDFVVLVASVVLIGVFSRTFWSTVAAAIPAELKWLNPFESGVLFERAVEIVKFIVYEGTAMWTAAFNFIGAALVVAFVVWLALSAARQRAFIGIAASLLAVVAALPSIGHAYEIRRSDGAVTVAADETINDTLLALGQTVTI